MTKHTVVIVSALITLFAVSSTQGSNRNEPQSVKCEDPNLHCPLRHACLKSQSKDGNIYVCCPYSDATLCPSSKTCCPLGLGKCESNLCQNPNGPTPKPIHQKVLVVSRKDPNYFEYYNKLEDFSVQRFFFDFLRQYEIQLPVEQITLLEPQYFRVDIFIRSLEAMLSDNSNYHKAIHDISREFKNLKDNLNNVLGIRVQKLNQLLDSLSIMLNKEVTGENKRSFSDYQRFLVTSEETIDFFRKERFDFAGAGLAQAFMYLSGIKPKTPEEDPQVHREKRAKRFVAVLFSQLGYLDEKDIIENNPVSPILDIEGVINAFKAFSTNSNQPKEALATLAKSVKSVIAALQQKAPENLKKLPSFRTVTKRALKFFDTIQTIQEKCESTGSSKNPAKMAADISKAFDEGLGAGAAMFGEMLNLPRICAGVVDDKQSSVLELPSVSDANAKAWYEGLFIGVSLKLNDESLKALLEQKALHPRTVIKTIRTYANAKILGYGEFSQADVIKYVTAMQEETARLEKSGKATTDLNLKALGDIWRAGFGSAPQYLQCVNKRKSGEKFDPLANLKSLVQLTRSNEFDYSNAGQAFGYYLANIYSYWMNNIFLKSKHNVQKLQKI